MKDNKFKIEFYPPSLPYTVTLHVIAPSRAAAEWFAKRESPGCEIKSIQKSTDATVYAESDEYGRRCS